LDPVKDYGLDLNYDIGSSIFEQSGICLRKKFEVVHTIEQWGEYKGWRYGFDKYARYLISG